MSLDTKGLCEERKKVRHKVKQVSGGGGLVTRSCPTLETPWTVAHQAPLSIGFTRQECWSGLPFPSPGDLPDQESNAGVLHCRQILY